MIWNIIQNGGLSTWQSQERLPVATSATPLCSQKKLYTLFGSQTGIAEGNDSSENEFCCKTRVKILPRTNVTKKSQKGIIAIAY